MANLTERKNPHTPVYGVKEFVYKCLSVTNFDLNYLQTGIVERAEIDLGYSSKFLWVDYQFLTK